MKIINVITIVMFLSLIYACTSSQTEVAVVGTLHGYHKKNQNYTYQNLYAFIETYNPDVIAVEIRPEDMGSSTEFLHNYYPREMVEVSSLFANREIYGIDWWNADIEGQKMSDEIISNVANIVWEKAYQADTNFMKRKPKIIDELYKKKLAIVADAPINEIVTGDYDSLTLCYYAELGRFLKGSPHEQLYQSYMKRHEMIAQKMVDVVDENPGKKILFLTGADHQVYARQKLEKTFGDDIELNVFFK